MYHRYGDDQTYLLHPVVVLVIVLVMRRRHDLHIPDAPRLPRAAAVVLEELAFRRSDFSSIATSNANSEVIGTRDATIAGVERTCDVSLADPNGND